MFKSIRVRFQLLTRKQQKSYLRITGIQVFLSFLDLIGVALLGVLGAIAMRGLQSRPTGNSVNTVLNFLRLNNFSFQSQVLVLGILSMLFLTGKSVFSLLQTRKIYKFLAMCSSQISVKAANLFLNRDISHVGGSNSAEYHHILGSGVTTMTLGVLGLASSLVADTSLLLIVGVGIFLLDPVIALTTFALFGTVGAVLYFGLRTYSRNIGTNLFTFSVSSNRAISEAMQTFRELHVRGETKYFSKIISGLKSDYSNSLADQALLPNVSKYIFEMILVLGGLLVCSLQFLTQDSSHAVASLVVFLAAGSRIAPALLRVQQNLLQIQTNLTNSESTIDFLSQFSNDHLEGDEDFSNHHISGFAISLMNISYTYPKKKSPSLEKVSLEIPQGTSVAIVGKSGSGKTTLVDVMLGLLTPSDGHVHIGKVEPKVFITHFPGSIGYVPQKVGFIDGTIRQNIVLTDQIFTDEEIIMSLEQASLKEFARIGPEGLDYQVGENGNKLSGGQRQRLGIARALVTQPKIVVLDEATSALDASTEQAISSTIENLRGEVTLVIIAHRLSTVLKSDMVAYLDNGHLIASGTFESVRSKVPNFDEQAKLLGI